MGVFERRGNSSSFKGAGAAVTATGVGFTLTTDNVNKKKSTAQHFQHSMISDEDVTLFRMCNYMFVDADAPNTGKSSCSGSGLIIVLTVTEVRRSSWVRDPLIVTSPNLYQEQHNNIYFFTLRFACWFGISVPVRGMWLFWFTWLHPLLSAVFGRSSLL